MTRFRELEALQSARAWWLTPCPRCRGDLWRNHLSRCKKQTAATKADTFVKTGDPTPTATADPEIAKTFRISASLSRRLKIYAAHSGQKEKDILAAALTEPLEGAGA